MTRRELHLVVPGPLDQRTGGYIYDARMVEGLRGEGRGVRVHEVGGRFPDPDEAARRGLDEALAGIEDGAIVLLDGLAMGALPEVVARHAERLATVALVHHPLADETGIGAELRERFLESERAGLRAVDGVIVTSVFTAGRLADFGVSADRIRVVVPGTERVVAKGPDPDPDVLRLLCLATLVRRKGQDLLVEALAGLEELPWSLVLVGSETRDPDFASELRRTIDTHGLADRIEIRGELGGAALEAVWDATDLFVLPSHHEGFGMVLTEALARGLPIVSTTAGAIPDTVPDGCGVLVEPDDVGALREGLRRVLEDGVLRQRLASDARAAADRLPTWSQQAARFARAIEELTG